MLFVGFVARVGLALVLGKMTDQLSLPIVIGRGGGLWAMRLYIVVGLYDYVGP